MANHKSAIKRAKQNEIRRLRNKGIRTQVKNVVKEVRASVSEKKIENAPVMLNTAKSIIDKASKTNVIHRRAASRKISRLNKLVNKITA